MYLLIWYSNSWTHIVDAILFVYATQQAAIPDPGNVWGLGKLHVRQLRVLHDPDHLCVRILVSHIHPLPDRVPVFIGERPLLLRHEEKSMLVCMC